MEKHAVLNNRIKHIEIRVATLLYQSAVLLFRQVLPYVSLYNCLIRYYRNFQVRHKTKTQQYRVVVYE